jgi:hypothetical protein
MFLSGRLSQWCKNHFSTSKNLSNTYIEVKFRDRIFLTISPGLFENFPGRVDRFIYNFIVQKTSLEKKHFIVSKKWKAFVKIEIIIKN